ncbi:MAG: DUF1697 domain-containing protein [Stagnimonas sp.]|nr:DUF1697 domain-containing protein [Stagnimonas sp.]
MRTWIALLRAVNVGGTGKLPMAELKAFCEELGFAKVRTYIASGNVLFESPKSELAIKTALERRLEQYAGKPVGVLVRTAAEMVAVAKANPFPGSAPNRVLAIFLDEAPAAEALQNLKHQKDERLALGAREIYVHYGEGMADSKLVIPAARAGTARNMNTVAKLATLAAEPG